MQENFYQEQQDLINLEEQNKKLYSELDEKSSKISELNNFIEQLKDSYSELEAEHKTSLEMYNKLLELQQEREMNNAQNCSVNYAQSETDKELCEKQINELNKELVYYMDLLA